MTIDQFRAAYKAQPFRPFVMHLADGGTIPVQSPEFVMAVPGGRTVIVAQSDESFNIIDLLLVTDLEFQRDQSASRKRRRN